MAKNSKEKMYENLKEAKANAAIEGIQVSSEEEELLAYMIDNEIEGDERASLINQYVNGTFTLPDKN